jgi:hypothetical protein
MAAIDELDLDCPVCHNVLCEPVTTPCGHAFCRPCLDDVLNSLYKRCPTCRGPLDSSLGVPSVSVLLASLVQRAAPEAYSSRQRELAAEAQHRRAAAAHGALPVRAAHVHGVQVAMPCPGQQAVLTWTRTEDLRFLNALYTFLPAPQRCFVQPCSGPSFGGVLLRVLACAPARGFGAGAGVNVRVLCLSRVALSEHSLEDNSREDDEAEELGPLYEVTAVRDPLPATPAEDQQLVSLVAGVKDVMTQWVARARAWDLGPHFRAQLDAMDSAHQPVGSTGGSPEQVSWLALRLLCPLPPWPPAVCWPDVRAAALYETSTAQRLALLLQAFQASMSQLDALSQTNSVVSGTIAAVASGANRVRGMLTSLLGQQPAAQAGPGTPEAQELVQPP